MKKQVAGGPNCVLENPKSRTRNEATWLPKSTINDDDCAWSSTAPYQRVQSASIRIAPEQGFEYHRDQRRAAVQDLTRRYDQQMPFTYSFNIG